MVPTLFNMTLFKYATNLTIFGSAISHTTLASKSDILLALLCLTLKMPGPISQNGNFYSNDASHPASSPKIS